MFLTKEMAVILILCLLLLQFSSQSSAEESYQFSLGGGNLTTAPADEKAPEPGLITAKYGFIIAKDFVPYLGTGLAYSYQPDSKTGDITKLKTGLAAQFGFNYKLGINSTLKLD